MKTMSLAIGMIFGLGATMGWAGEKSAQKSVDFSYSPPEWQTAICLPDDPQKSLVDKSGELLYHYRLGGREFGTRVAVEVITNTVWQKQELLSPRIPIVRTFRSADGLQIVEEAFAVTDLPQAKPAESARNDMIIVRVTNTGDTGRKLQPRLKVDTTLGCLCEAQKVVINKHETVTTSLKMTGGVDESSSRKVIPLEELSIEPGKTAEFFVLYSGGSPVLISPATLKQARVAREDAVAYWDRAPLPYGRIQVPDAGIQALIDSSIRNIWQAREIKKGLPAFQVGPTEYRSLWIVDGAFLLEAATILGAGGQARNGVAYELTHQKDDGRIEVMQDAYGYWKENGIVLWTCIRHAQLTQDKQWLESVWPRLQRVAAFIKVLRTDNPVPCKDRVIPRKAHSPLDAGLMPHGIVDGGLGNGVDYSNNYWNLIGLRSLIEAARWLGKDEEAAEWQKEYDDFLGVFRKAAARDMLKDGRGNAYLPILMGEAGAKELPQRAQWSFCHAVYPGQIFAKDDPLVAGNLAMLEATEREGMVYGTGWDATGIWNYFASFYGHAWLWQGNGAKAAEALYAFANHAAPMLVWREEQSLRGEKYNKVGDMPHNWASAEFIRLATHLLAIDRGNELHLFEGLPKEWVRPGMVTRLTGIATPFGALTLDLRVARNGKSAKLVVEPMSDSACKKIIVHLGGWADGDLKAIREFEPGKRLKLTIPISQ